MRSDKILLGGLHYKSDAVFNTPPKASSKKIVEQLLVNTTATMTSFSDALEAKIRSKSGIKDLNKHQVTNLKSIIKVYDHVVDATTINSASVCAMPIIRGLKVALYYKLQGVNYSLVNAEVKDSTITDKLSDPKLCGNVHESIKAWVEMFKLGETVTVPDNLKVGEVEDTGLRLDYDEDNLPTALKVDVVLTVNAIELLNSRYTVEAIIRGWLADPNYMIVTNQPKMVAIALGVSASSGMLSPAFTIQSEKLDESTSAMLHTKVSKLEKLRSLGFNVPFFDTKWGLEEPTGRFIFGDTLHTSLESVNPMLMSIQETNKKFLKATQSEKDKKLLIARSTSLEVDTDDYLNHFRTFPYLVLGVEIVPNFEFIRNHMSASDQVVSAIRVRRNDDISELYIWDISRILGLGYNDSSTFIDVTGYEGRKNPITRSNINILKKQGIHIDYESALEFFKNVMPVLKENREFSEPERSITRRKTK